MFQQIPASVKTHVHKHGGKGSASSWIASGSYPKDEHPCLGGYCSSVANGGTNTRPGMGGDRQRDRAVQPDSQDQRRIRTQVDVV
jgi:hypothetical protein